MATSGQKIHGPKKAVAPELGYMQQGEIFRYINVHHKQAE